MSQRPDALVETCRAAALDDAEIEAMSRLSQLVWGRTGSLSDDQRARAQRLRAKEDGHCADQQVHRVLIAGALVAYAHSFRRTVAVADVRREVLALASVKTHPGQRGKGFGAAVVRAAFARLDGLLAVCLFQTDIPGFYERLGARVVDHPFINGEGGRAFWSRCAMVWPAAPAWMSGQIDLCGEGW